MSTVLRYPVLSEMAHHMGTLAPKPDGNEQEFDPPPFSLLPIAGDSEKVAALRNEARAQCSLDSATQIKDIFPTSSLQAGPVMSYLKNPGAYMVQSVYHIPASARVDRIRLETAWKNVVRRTQCLRSRFIEHGGDIYQVILDKERHLWYWTIMEYDLDRRITLKQASRFKLGEPMSWLTLTPQNNDPWGTPEPHSLSGFALIWNIHHALADGWSSSLIISDLEEEYFRLGQYTYEGTDNVVLSVEPPIHSSPPFQRFIRL